MSVKDLMSMSHDELLKRLKRNIEATRRNHDAAVLFGSLGISPDMYSRYIQAVSEIDKFNDEIDELTEGK